MRLRKTMCRTKGRKSNILCPSQEKMKIHEIEVSVFPMSLYNL